MSSLGMLESSLVGTSFDFIFSTSSSVTVSLLGSTPSSIDIFIYLFMVSLCMPSVLEILLTDSFLPILRSISLFCHMYLPVRHIMPPDFFRGNYTALLYRGGTMLVKKTSFRWYNEPEKNPFLVVHS